MIRREAVFSEHHPVTAAAKVPSNPNGMAHPRRKPKTLTLLRYPIVQLPNRRPGSDPRRLFHGIHGHVVEINQIKNQEWGLITFLGISVREPFVVMAAAANSDSQGFGVSEELKRVFLIGYWRTDTNEELLGVYMSLKMAVWFWELRIRHCFRPSSIYAEA
nr:uncharacterized protein LOC111201667 [Ipomoea trifida]